jgi:hypothetical protein
MDIKKVDEIAFVFGDNKCYLCNTTASASTMKPLSGPKRAKFVLMVLHTYIS